MEPDFIHAYEAEIATVPPLSLARELDCIRQIRAATPQAEQAAKILIEANLALVVSIAKQYQSKTKVPLLNLIQEGNLGLVNAIQALHENDPDNFTKTAANHAEQAIVKAIAGA